MQSKLVKILFPTDLQVRRWNWLRVTLNSVINTTSRWKSGQDWGRRQQTNQTQTRQVY